MMVHRPFTGLVLNGHLKPTYFFYFFLGWSVLLWRMLLCIIILTGAILLPTWCLCMLQIWGGGGRGLCFVSFQAKIRSYTSTQDESVHTLLQWYPVPLSLTRVKLMRGCFLADTRHKTNTAFHKGEEAMTKSTPQTASSHLVTSGRSNSVINKRVLQKLFSIYKPCLKSIHKTNPYTHKTKITWG